MYITELSAINFKCFRDIKVDGLTPITIIGGKNNTGKSALLEGIFLKFGFRAPEIYYSLAGLRNGMAELQITPERIWDPLFYYFKSTELQISTVDYKNQKSELRLDKVTDDTNRLVTSRNVLQSLLKGGTPANEIDSAYYAIQYTYSGKDNTETGQFSIKDNGIEFVSAGQLPTPGVSQLVKVAFYKSSFSISMGELAELVSKQIVSGNKETLLGVLRIFNGDIEDVMVMLDNNRPYVYVALKDGLKIPLSHMGDGINKALRLLLIILVAPDGIVMIDEIENGFHYSVYSQILHALYKTAASQHTQLIITTHNRDILKESVSVLEGSRYTNDLSYHRMSRENENVTSYSFTYEELAEALELEWEVR